MREPLSDNSMVGLVLSLALLIIVVVLFAKYSKLRGEVEARARELFERWRDGELGRAAEERAKILFEEWRAREEDRIREDAIRRSASTIMGRVGEQLAPLLIFSSYGIDPRDLRFVGTPIDFIAFKGLSSGRLEEVVFIEVKSGRTESLTSREDEVRRVVESGKVRWLLVHLPRELGRGHRGS